jgi:hypothetical protein
MSMTRFRLALGVLLAALASGAAACGDADDTASMTTGGDSAEFVRSDLPQLAFNPDDVPPDTELNTQKMGYGAVASKGIGDRWVREQREIGMEQDYDVQFVGNTVSEPFVESIVYLYPDEASAAKGLELALKQNRDVTTPVEDLDASSLGDGAWGISGKFAGQQETATFGWRTANVVQMSVWGGDSPAVNAEKAERGAHMLQSQAEEALAG